MKTATRTKLENANFPLLQITWERDKDQHGWKGEATVWTEANKAEEKTFSISIRLSVPLGRVYIDFENFGYGAFCSDSFEGVDIIMRDLQQATIWTANAIKPWKATQPESGKV
jgi:hypothetical protein